jgi:glycosyltransferase involved in cell wall biosynthesis
VRILFVGMISERKGLDELLLAIGRLVANGVRNFHVDLVGGEEVFGESLRYRKLFRRQGIADWVTFHGLKLGTQRDIFYQQADVHVLPSRNESFGIVNLEAMAHGLPVVSTRTGAIPEYLEDGEQGFLVEPGDADGLMQALRRLIDDPELRARMGASARQRAQRYDWQILWKDLDHVYRCALSTNVAAQPRSRSA